jgi:uncharacterized protein (TIGR02646 family)
VIKVERQKDEPTGLAARREQQLLGLGASRPERTTAHAHAYQAVKSELIKQQRHKCCYCERRTVPDHNDVEHYRPFALYWWLAWTWENLLFACAACNRKGGKLDQFPLAVNSIRLTFPEQPPGREQPLLLDPSTDEPRDHIRFKLLPNGRWAPIGLTERGQATIRIVDLSRDTYLEQFAHHVTSVVMPVVADIKRELAVGLSPSFREYWRTKCAQLLDPDRDFRALSEDVLRHEFPSFPEPPPGPALNE